MSVCSCTDIWWHCHIVWVFIDSLKHLFVLLIHLSVTLLHFLNYDCNVYLSCKNCIVRSLYSIILRLELWSCHVQSNLLNLTFFLHIWIFWTNFVVIEFLCRNRLSSLNSPCNGCWITRNAKLEIFLVGEHFPRRLLPPQDESSCSHVDWLIS